MTLDYSAVFGGIPFVVDQAMSVRIMDINRGEMTDEEQQSPRKYQSKTDLIDELDRKLPWKYLQDFSLPSNYPGRNLGAIAIQAQIDPQPNPDLDPFNWYYPYGASRWSVFRGLATSSMAKAMLAATQGRLALPFILKQSPISPNNQQNAVAKYTVTSNMFMLPPRPLGETGGSMDGLYLITLVDDRYYFQGTPATLKVTPGTTWSNLLSTLASALGINLTIPVIPSVYGLPNPDSQLWTNQESAPALLDAVAYNLGSQIVRNYNGTYVLQNPTQSQAIILANRGNASSVVRTAGGDIFNSGTKLPIGNLNASRNSVVPNFTPVSFPKYVIGNDPVPHFLNTRNTSQRPTSWFEESYGDVYTVNVPIASGGPFVSGLVGVNTTNYIHTTAKALYSGDIQASGNPLNVSGLIALAMQLAQDKYNAQIASALDEVYPGIVNWTPEGIHDIIWTYSAKSHQATTRVMRAEWNLTSTEFQHSTPPLSGYSPVPIGVGGPTVAQTWKDSFSGNISTTLNQSGVGSGDSSIIFNAIDYFPTQNRWRGSIDNEKVLFEGTSGGVTVNIVYRGIDGTLISTHNSGAVIAQITPDTGYGINLITEEKGQYVYPGPWTSGGITGIHRIPQTQSVQVLSTATQTINNISHYSGLVGLYDTTQNSGSQFQSREKCWIVDRNSKTLVSGKWYDGQFVGFSASGPVSPVYAVDEYPTSAAGGSYSGFNVRSQDNVSLFSGVNRLSFVTPDGFSLSQPGGDGTDNVQVDLLPATESGTGNVTTGLQRIAGDKTLIGTLILGFPTIQYFDLGGFAQSGNTQYIGRITGINGGSGKIGGLIISPCNYKDTDRNSLQIDSGGVHLASGSYFIRGVIGRDGTGDAGEQATGGLITSGTRSGSIANIANLTIGAAFVGLSGIGFTYFAQSGTETASLLSGAVTSGNIASGTIGQFPLASGAVQSGQLGQGAIGPGVIASGTISNTSYASGGSPSLFFDTSFVAGEAFSGVSPVCLSSGGVLLTAYSTSGFRTPAIGIVFDNVASGNTATVVTMGKSTVTSGLDIKWSGHVGESVYVGSGGRIVLSGDNSLTGAVLTQRVGVALSGGLFVRISPDVFTALTQYVGR